MSYLSPLSGVERKLAFGDARAAVDPERTSASADVMRCKVRVSLS